jgi:hypothetical protein
MLVDALHKVGAARSIVIDEDGEVLAGNGVLEAAGEAGIERVQVVDADGETLIAVRRTGLTADQKRSLAIYDNRVAELAEWNWEQLAEDKAAGLELEPWFSEEEQAKGMGEAPADGAEPALTEQWMIVVTCSGESHQRDLLDRFLAEGLQCRAVAS